MPDIQLVPTAEQQRKPPGRKTPPQSGDVRHGRASTTNNDALPGIDGRARNARRYADLVEAVTADPEQCCQRVLIRRFVGATVLAELLEARFIAGSEVSVQAIASLCQALVSLSGKIAETQTPNIEELLRGAPKQVSHE